MGGNLRASRLNGSLTARVGIRAIILLGAVLTAGCAGEFDRLETVLHRRSAALARLPEEDRDWKEWYPAPGQSVGEVSPSGAGMPLSGTLTVEHARELALLDNPDIHAARARLEQALARIAEARATYFPTVTLAHDSIRTFLTPGSRNRLNIPITQPQVDLPSTLAGLQTGDFNTLLNTLATPLFAQPGGSGISQSFSEHTSSVAVNWTLFDGFAREARLLSTKYTFGAAKMSLADAQRLLTRAVNTAFYQAQLGKEQVRIAQADAEFSQDQLAVAQKKMEAGKATQSDVGNFEVRWRAALADLVTAEGLLQNARTVLAELMGIDSAMLPEALQLSRLSDETESDLTPPVAEDWVNRAFESRPDLAQKDFEVKSKSEEARVARAQYLPSVFATGTYGFDRTSNLAYRNDDQAASAGVELRWQIYTGGARTARLRRTEAERLEQAAELRRLRQLVVSEVRQAVIDVINAQEQVRLQRLNLTSATENRRIVEAEYAAGKAPLVRLNEAQRDLIGTEVGLARARIRLREAWSALRTAAAAYASEPLTVAD